MMSDELGRQTLTRQMTAALSERISNGLYAPGEKLPTEQKLMEEFAVSRTVVREAVASLRAAGLVNTKQGVGAFVLAKQPTENFRIDASHLEVAEEISAVLELRIALETEAAGLAAVRRTEEDVAALMSNLEEMSTAIENGDDALVTDLQFHQLVATATKNSHFVNLFRYLGEVVIPRSRLQTFKLDGLSRREYLTRVYREHSRIASCITRSDVDAARAAMRLHLADSRERLRRYMSDGEASTLPYPDADLRFDPT